MRACFLIPGADFLADVAAEDLAADGRAQLFRNGAALLVEGTGIFGGPANAGLAGEIGLDERAGIDVRARLEAADAVVERGFEGPEASKKRVVIVGGAEFAARVGLASPGVAGNP